MEATLGKRISAYRKQLGMTQEQLAEKLGLTAQAVSKWENDVSCPDITILPKLADIFNVTIDQLLGREPPASQPAETVVIDPKHSKSCFEYDSDSGKMNFHWKGEKLEGIGLACWVLITGGVYLAVQLLHMNVSFWNVLWPSFLFTYGLFGVYPKFSMLRLGCGMAGAYFLSEKLELLTFKPNSGILFAGVVLLLGLGLLADAFRKKKHKQYHPDQNIYSHKGKVFQDYSVDGTAFSFDASFGSHTQFVQMDCLSSGSISTNFGDYTVDLSGVASIAHVCKLQADCSFGDLTILVPHRYALVPDSCTSFAGFDIQGSPDANPAGTIQLNADASFAQIVIQYI